MGARVDAVPEGSLYLWCYRQGLRHCELADVMTAVSMSGRTLRGKDVGNYWNGWYRSDLYGEGCGWSRSVLEAVPMPAQRKVPRWSDFPEHPYVFGREVEERWVPCSSLGRPLIRWSAGCMMRDEAEAMRGCRSLAENLKGTHMLVVDCDGDHDEGALDLEVIAHLLPLGWSTHMMAKPRTCCDYGQSVPEELEEAPASFHLTFLCDRVVPTMHFPRAHVDVIGNRANSLRYLKDKVHNGLPMAFMTDDIWDYVMEIVRRREVS